MNVKPRLLRPVDPPFGLYFRVGHVDHLAVAQLTADLPGSFSGAVISATRRERNADLVQQLRASQLEAVLDPHSVELATAGGVARPPLQRLPWASAAPHQAAELFGDAGSSMVNSIAAAVSDGGFSAVLAPTHYLSGAADPWLRSDRALTLRLRRALDDDGRQATPIYYPLVLHRKALGDPRQRRELIASLADLPIDAVWLRAHPFGANSGAAALKAYIESCRDLQQLGIPLVAERTGTAGIALLAFGAVGGIESGITNGERFDVSTLSRASKPGKGFALPPRVYIDALGVFMKPERAREFFAVRGMRPHFACRDTACCRNGVQSMVQEPQRHFLRSRVAGVGRLSRVSSSARSSVYLEEFLRPATDLILRASKIDPLLKKDRKRLEGWRHTLGIMHQSRSATGQPAVPMGQRIVNRRPA